MCDDSPHGTDEALHKESVPMYRHVACPFAVIPIIITLIACGGQAPPRAHPGRVPGGIATAVPGTVGPGSAAGSAAVGAGAPGAGAECGAVAAGDGDHRGVLSERAVLSG